MRPSTILSGFELVGLEGGLGGVSFTIRWVLVS